MELLIIYFSIVARPGARHRGSLRKYFHLCNVRWLRFVPRAIKQLLTQLYRMVNLL
jgi:hypothetical protein